MVLCRFYQQGYCRFGNNCRFEHAGNTPQLFTQPPANDNYYGSSNYGQSSRISGGGQSNYDTSVGNNRFGPLANNTVDNRTRNYGGGQSNSNTAKPTFNEFVAGVLQEVELGIKGNQWPFSCFGPMKEGDNWPGLVDMSPEELRFEAYNLQQEGRSLDTYIQGVEQLKNSQMTNNIELKGRSPAIMEILRKIYQGQKLENSTTVNTALFGQRSAMTGGGASQFSFSLDQIKSGNAQQQSTMPSLPFGQSSSISGLPLTTNAAPIQTFGSSNAFTGNAPQVQTFLDQPAPPQQQENIFGSSVLQNLSRSAVISHSFFQNVEQTRTVQPKADNNSAASGTAYTSMDDLSNEEKEQFSAATFTLGSIPIRPPPVEFC